MSVEMLGMLIFISLGGMLLEMRVAKQSMYKNYSTRQKTLIYLKYGLRGATFWIWLCPYLAYKNICLICKWIRNLILDL